MQETIVDPRQLTPEEHAEGVRQAQVLFKLPPRKGNRGMPANTLKNKICK